MSGNKMPSDMPSRSIVPPQLLNLIYECSGDISVANEKCPSNLPVPQMVGAGWSGFSYVFATGRHPRLTSLQLK